MPEMSDAQKQVSLGAVGLLTGFDFLPSMHSCTKFLHALGASLDHNSMSISPAEVFNKTYDKITEWHI